MTTLSSLFCFVLEEAGTLDGDRARCLHGLACGKTYNPSVHSSLWTTLLPTCQSRPPAWERTARDGMKSAGRWVRKEGASSKWGRPTRCITSSVAPGRARPYPNCRLLCFPSWPHETKTLPQRRRLLTTTCCENSRRDPDALPLKIAAVGCLGPSLQSSATKTLITALIPV